jgi:hypothetical protein
LKNTIFIIFFLFAIKNSYGSIIFNSAVMSVQDSSFVETYTNTDTTKSATKSDHYKSYEEAYLSFNYLGIINRTIVVNYDGNFYLPIREIFQQLLISYEADKKSDVFKGFFIYPDSLYEIDFANLKFKSYKTEFAFSADEFIKTDLDYYLRTDFYDKAFKLSFTIDIRNLALKLISEEILPVYSKFLREKKYNYLASYHKTEDFPLLFPRERYLLMGGFFDYNISASFAEYNQPFYNYDFGVGLELLGGDLKASTVGSIARNDFVNPIYEYTWRWAEEKNNIISQVSVGDLTGVGIGTYRFEGIQVGNQPLTPRESFARFLMSDRTIPGSTVELYVNDQLIDYAKTDQAGNFNFWLPLDYGSSFVTLKYYGPNGETKVVEQYYQTPYVINPPGEFNYTVNLGRLNELTNKYFQMSGIYGITEWLSDLAGVEYLDYQPFREPVFYNSLTARVNSGYMFNLLTAPKAFYQLSANAVYPSLTSINLSYRYYQANEIYNPGKINSEITSSLNLPLYFDESPLNIQMIGFYRGLGSSNFYDMNFNISKNFGRFTPNIMYRYQQFGDNIYVSKQAFLTLGLINTLDLPQPFNFLKGALINTGLIFNQFEENLESFYFLIASNVTNTIRLQFDYDRNFTYNFNNIRLNIFLDLPYTRSYTTVGNDYFTTNLQGSILFDYFNSQINFYNRSQIGRSVSSFRMFVDDNGNSVFNEGEQLIDGAKVNIQSVNNNFRVHKNETQVRDLNPYTTYNVEIDESEVENPLYTARSKLFSVESGPNYVKNVDVPFYSVSEISGDVNRYSDIIKSPLSGIKIHIEGVDNDQKITVNTFSDGSYYYYGLRPGSFKIYVDKEQLEYLGNISIPGEYVLNLGLIGSEKPFEGLNFDLYKKEAEENQQ